MARRTREKSQSKYYHVIVRGIGKQVLFEEQKDYLFYLNILEKYSQETDISVCAYCLMENHVHLLLYDPEDHLAELMKKLGVVYSKYYNRTYERTGHLFQDRYLSEPVENEPYLLTVFRYILKNPQKAGICNAEDYKWSSYKEYALRDSFVRTDIFEKIIGPRTEYAAFIAGEETGECLEYDLSHRDDEWARCVIQNLLGTESGTVLQKYDRVNRDKALIQLKKAGLSIRQIERLTGINRGVIQKAGKEKVVKRTVPNDTKRGKR